MSQAFILGDGAYAQELEKYLTIMFEGIPRTEKPIITMISKDGMEKYQDLLNGESKDQMWTYLGSGKPEIRVRMLAEALGEFGPPVKLGCFECTS
jgi:hypothetical protein